jgi:hypothetical protein
MVLIKMHKDYLNSAPIWKAKLEANSGRLNAKKEEVKILFKKKFFFDSLFIRNYIFMRIIPQKMMLLLEY